jgi:hypothetical protein
MSERGERGLWRVTVNRVVEIGDGFRLGDVLLNIVLR